MALWQLWWAWIVAGIGIAILEVVVPGYIFLGFAAGAVVTGLLLLVGMLGGGLAWLLLAFGLLSLVAWVLFRRLFGLPGGGAKIWDRDINDG